MSKIFIGDYVSYNGYRECTTGYVVECRGGYAGRWKVKADTGSIFYASSRDLTVLIPSPNRPRVSESRLSANEKIDLILDYLGIEIENTPRIMKRDDDEKNER